MEDTFHLGIKALIRNSENKILLLKVNIKKLKDHSDGTYWDIPGGRIERNSTIEDTLTREIAEEIGVSAIFDVKPIEMMLSNIRIPLKDSDVGLILAIYSCSIPTSSEIILSDEHSEFGWFTPLEAAKLLSYKYPKDFTEKVTTL